jgi:CO/xanthine dehydrogenase FAD-binding subunit
MDVLSPRSLAEALALKAEHPDARPIQGGTDVMVELNFDRTRPATILNLNELAELRGWSRENGTLRLGAALTYTEALEGPLAELFPALPPLHVRDAEVELASVRGTRALPLADFLVGPKQNALAPDELVTAVRVPAEPRGTETFMKVGPRNAMVIAVVSLALRVDRERGELVACFGSAGPVPGLVRGRLNERDEFPELVASAARPIDDVRGTAAYRRHALRVLTARALERCLA